MSETAQATYESNQAPTVDATASTERCCCRPNLDANSSASDPLEVTIVRPHLTRARAVKSLGVALLNLFTRAAIVMLAVHVLTPLDPNYWQVLLFCWALPLAFRGTRDSQPIWTKSAEER